MEAEQPSLWIEISSAACPPEGLARVGRGRHHRSNGNSTAFQSGRMALSPAKETVTVFLGRRVNSPEQAVAFAVRTGGEIERACTPCFATVPECESPQAVYHDGFLLGAGVFQQAPEVAVGLEGHDGAAAEIAHQQLVGVLAEGAGRNGQAPRRADLIQPAASLRAGSEAAERARVHVKCINQT